MEHTALRPKPMPGEEPGSGGPAGQDRRPAASRRSRRPAAVAHVLLAALVLLLAGIGLGTVGGTVIALTRPPGHAPLRPADTFGPAPTGPAPTGPAPTGPGRASPGPSVPVPPAVGRSPSGVAGRPPPGVGRDPR